MVNIVNEGIERPDPLLQSGFQTHPFVQRQYSRDDVERYQTFRALLLPVNREGDAYPVE